MDKTTYTTTVVKSKDRVQRILNYPLKKRNNYMSSRIYI